MKATKLYRLVFGLILLTVMVSACGTPPATSSGGDTPSGDTTAPAKTELPSEGPRIGGTLRSTFQTEDPTLLDPVVPYDNASIFTSLQIYDQFFRVARDGTVEPDAALDYTVSDDGLQYSFKMRQGMKFYDGSPVTLDDMLYSLGRFQSSANWGYLLPPGMTYEGVGHDTIKVTLQSPYAPFISSLSTVAASIVPKAQVEAQGDAFWEKPVGSGPFFVEEWVHGNHLTLARNPFYWDAPKPYLDKVVMELVSDDNTRMLKFQNGELDVALNVPYNQVSTMGSIQGAAVQVKPMLATLLVELNAAVKPLDDVNVRIALQHATDREAIVKTALYGTGEVATMLWPKGLLHWDDTVTGYPFDLAKAKERLAKSATPNGFEINLSYAAGDVVGEQTAALIKDQWGQIGVDVTLEPLEGTLQNNNMLAGNYETAISSWTSDVYDPSQLNVAYLCVLTEAMMGSCNDTFDKLAVEADQIVDPVERQAAYAELFRVAEEWATMNPLFYSPSRTAVWDYVKGFELAPTLYARYWEAWLEN